MGDVLYFESNLLDGGLKKTWPKKYGDTVIDQKSDGTNQWSKDSDTTKEHRTHLLFFGNQTIKQNAWIFETHVNNPFSPLI